MIQDFITDIENADNPTLIALLLVVIYKTIQLGLSTVKGFFRNDQTQLDFMRDLLQENIQTRKELVESNRRSDETNAKVMTYLAENTAALSYLNHEVIGLKSTAQVIHQSGEQSQQLLQDNVTKLDTLIAKIDTDQQTRQSSDTQTQALLQKVLQHQQWLHLRLMSDYPQLALPEPKEKPHVQVTDNKPSPPRPQRIPPATSHLGAA